MSDAPETATTETGTTTDDGPDRGAPPSTVAAPADAPEAPFSADELAELEHLGDVGGVGSGFRAAAELLEDELKAKSKTRRAVEMLVSASIVVLIFVRFIPTWFDVEYAQVWDELAAVQPLALVGIALFWVFTMWTYAAFLAQSLPGLTKGQGMVTNFSGSALSNVVPFGGAAGIGATYAQCLSWGFSAPGITLSVLVSGVWNVFAKLGLPALVLVVLLAEGHATEGLGVAAAIGLAAVTGGVILFALITRSESLAEATGRFVERVVNALRRLLRKPPHPIAHHVTDFRHRTMGLVRARWKGLSVWMVVYKICQGLLAVFCARAIGITPDQVGWVELFAVYAFGELLTTIPISPSGVGFVEAGSTAMLVAFGGGEEQALAAVLLYRAFTYLFEIPLGAVGWMTWAGKRSWRKPVGSADVVLDGRPG